MTRLTTITGLSLIGTILIASLLGTPARAQPINGARLVQVDKNGYLLTLFDNYPAIDFNATGYPIAAYSTRLLPGSPGTVMTGAVPSRSIFANATLGFPGWNFVYARSPLNGTFKILGYDADGTYTINNVSHEQSPGDFTVVYTPAVGPLGNCGLNNPNGTIITPPCINKSDNSLSLLPGHKLRWINLIQDNFALNPTDYGVTNSTVTPCGHESGGVCSANQWLFDPYDYCWDVIHNQSVCAATSEASPFYFTQNEETNPAYRATTSNGLLNYTFIDHPESPPEIRGIAPSVTFNTFLADWDGSIPGQVIIYEGFSWGYQSVKSSAPSGATEMGSTVPISFGVGADPGSMKFEHVVCSSGCVAIHNYTISTVGGNVIPVDRLSLVLDIIAPYAIAAGIVSAIITIALLRKAATRASRLSVIY